MLAASCILFGCQPELDRDAKLGFSIVVLFASTTAAGAAYLLGVLQIVLKRRRSRLVLLD